MIINLFYAFGIQEEELQNLVQIAKNGQQARTRGLSMFGRVGLKNTFLVSRTRVRSCYKSHHFTPENWIIGYRFSLRKYVDRIDRISTEFAI